MLLIILGYFENEEKFKGKNEYHPHTQHLKPY